MAKNSITVQTNINGDGYIFSGSSRQPTLAEVANYCHENHIPIEGVFITAVRINGGGRLAMNRSEILDAARECVCKNREHDYGEPEDNFKTIGLLWAVYLRAAHPELACKMPINGIDAKDVAAMMALLKIARIATTDKEDSFVDLAGYAACAGEIASKEKTVLDGICKQTEVEA